MRRQTADPPHDSTRPFTETRPVRPPLPAGEGWGEGEKMEHPGAFAHPETSHAFILSPALSLGGRGRPLVACSTIHRRLPVPRVRGSDEGAAHCARGGRAPRKKLNRNRVACLLRTMHAPGPRVTSLALLRQVTTWEDQPAWATFSHLYRPLIHAYALRSGLTPEEAQELTQDLLLEVAEHLRKDEYEPARGSFRGWLFRLARWRITNQFHKRRPGHISLDQPGVTEAVKRCRKQSQKPSKKALN